MLNVIVSSSPLWPLYGNAATEENIKALTATYSNCSMAVMDYLHKGRGLRTDGFQELLSIACVSFVWGIIRIQEFIVNLGLFLGGNAETPVSFVS